MSRTVMVCVAVAVSFLSATMSGCRKAPAKMPPPASEATAVSLPTAQSKYDCAQVKPATAPAGAPADDILGVRLGMSPAAAAAVLACGNATYVLSTNQGGRFELPAIEHGPQPQTSLDAEVRDNKGMGGPAGIYDVYQPSFVAGDRVEVVFLGLAGQERAASLTRDVRYPDGKHPSFPTETQALTAKYGPPTSDTGLLGNAYEELQWVRNPSGAPMSPKNPSYPNCASTTSVTPGCGLTIAAHLTDAADGGVVEINLSVMNPTATEAAFDAEKAAIAAINKPTAAATKF